MVLSANICPETISNPFGIRQGMNFKNVHVCAVDTFPQAALKSPFVFSVSMFFSFNWIFYWHAATKSSKYSLRCMSKSSSVFWPQLCLQAPCNVLHMLFLSSKWLLQENWRHNDSGKGLAHTGFGSKQNAMLHSLGKSGQYCWIATPSFQTAMIKMATK